MKELLLVIIYIASTAAFLPQFKHHEAAKITETIRDISSWETVICPSSTGKLSTGQVLHSQQSVKWTRDGRIITNKDDVIIDNVLHGDLSIPNAKPTDSGIYIVEIGTSSGIFSITFPVSIPDTSLKLIDTERNFTVKQHDRVELKVQYAKIGLSTWRFENKILNPTNESKHFFLPNPKQHGIDTGSVLVIRNIHKRHSGFYRFTHDVKGCQNSVVIHVDVDDMQKDRFGKQGRILKDPLLAFTVLATKSLFSRVKSNPVLFVIIIVAIVVVIGGVLITCVVFILDIRRMSKNGRGKKGKQKEGATKNRFQLSEDPIIKKLIEKYYQSKRDYEKIRNQEEYKYLLSMDMDRITNTQNGTDVISSAGEKSTQTHQIVIDIKKQ